MEKRYAALKLTTQSAHATLASATPPRKLASNGRTASEGRVNSLSDSAFAATCALLRTGGLPWAYLVTGAWGFLRLG
jgi:hypothetical protein